MIKHRKYIIENSGLDNLKLAVISDVHNKKITPDSRIFSILKKISPDYIIFAGDMISRTTTDLSSFELLCEKCAEFGDIYLAYGNHEQSTPKEILDDYIKITEKYNINILDNKSLDFGKFELIGLTLDYSVYKNSDGTYRNLTTPDKKMIDNLIGTKNRDKFTVLIAHNPLFFDVYAEWGANLVISGHMHGGIVQLPVCGGMLSPERSFFPKYTYGKYTIGNSDMIVSSGIGKFRIFNPADICEITLK